MSISVYSTTINAIKFSLYSLCTRALERTVLNILWSEVAIQKSVTLDSAAANVNSYI